MRDREVGGKRQCSHELILHTPGISFVPLSIPKIFLQDAGDIKMKKIRFMPSAEKLSIQDKKK